MISGRAIIALGMIGVGFLILRKGVAVASTMQGLGDLGALTQAEFDAQQAQDRAMLTTITDLPVVIPSLVPRNGPTLRV